jgi:hypothetical protein
MLIERTSSAQNWKS